MKRHCRFQHACVIAIFILASAANSFAADSKAQPLAARPYLSYFAASIDRLLAACETVFESVDRPDLSASISERLTRYRDFAGIDRNKPFGTMWTWEETKQVEILFLPIKEIDELLKTATFGVVGYHQVNRNHYELEKPGSPYHLLIRNDYALLADSPSSIQGLRISPEQLTRGLRDQYDFVAYLDLKQLPRTAKTQFVDRVLSVVEPWLQEHDKEPQESANLRKSIGKVTLELLQRLVLDTSSVTVGGQLDPKSRVFSFEVTVEPTKGSTLETGLNRLISRRSEFTSMISPDVPAGVAINLPLGGMIEQILGQPNDKKSKPSNLEAGLQLVGPGMGQLALIGALRGQEVSLLNSAIPQLLLRLEKVGQLASLSESFDVHQGTVFHSLIPREMPTAITQLVGSDVEIIVGQGKHSFWLAIGQPATLLERLKEAIDLVDEPSTTRSAGPLVRARFQARQLPELVTSEAVLPTIDPETSRIAFEKGGDGFSLTIEPVASGLKLRIEAEEGFIRLIGREWVKQVDH